MKKVMRVALLHIARFGESSMGLGVWSCALTDATESDVHGGFFSLN